MLKVDHMHKTFPVVIETDENGGYSAFFPDVLGCVAAGDTIEECYEDAIQALTLHLAGMVDDGESIPEATRLTEVSVDDDIKVADLLLITVPISGRKTRVNMTLDNAILTAIDPVTTNRSAFIEDAAIAELKRRSVVS